MAELGRLKLRLTFKTTKEIKFLESNRIQIRAIGSLFELVHCVRWPVGLRIAICNRMSTFVYQ